MEFGLKNFGFKVWFWNINGQFEEKSQHFLERSRNV